MNEPPVSLSEQLTLAQKDKGALNRLINTYIPFIKKCAAAVFFKGQARYDNATEAMLAFIQSVQTYRPEAGAFLPYAQTVIRNRLINAARREAKIQKPLFSVSARVDERDIRWEQESAERRYTGDEERDNLRMEIAEINGVFSQWGFDLETLVRRCPKQERSRKACHGIARKALQDRALVAEMLAARRLPLTRLAALAGCSEKTLEKYRRYISAVIIIMEGDYPYIRSFLPQFFDTEGTR
jgi:RNA polymerase sigma factor